MPAPVRLGVLPATATLLLLVLPAPSATAATPTSGECPVASQVAGLLERGYPGTALRLVDEVRKARPGVQGQAPECVGEAVRAVQARSRADLLAARARASFRAGRSEDAGELVRSSLQEDRANSAALALRAELAQTSAQVSATAWADVRSAWLTPSTTLLRDALLWLVLGLALARALAFGLPRLGSRAGRDTSPAERLGAALQAPPRRPEPLGPRTQGWPRRLGRSAWRGARSAWWRGCSVAGWALLAIAAAGLVTVRGDAREWLVTGVVLLAAGSLVIALRWCAGRGVLVTTSGEGAPTADEVHGLIRALAPDSPRGVERPQGTDATVFSGVDLLSKSTVPWVMAVSTVIDLVRPPVPWRLRIQAHEGGALSYELHRNGARLTGGMITPSQVRRVAGLPDEDDTEFPLAVFPAAQAVMRVALVSDKRGLAGATGSQSLAYQYLAAQETRGSDAAKALAAHAVGLDPGNVLALVGYWHALYREATDHADLDAYVGLLSGQLDAEEISKEPALRLRIMLTRLAVGINARAAGSSEVRDLHGWAGKLCNELVSQQVAAGRAGVEDPLDAFARTFDAMSRSVGFRCRRWDDPEIAALPATVEPETVGPAVNYALACAHAAATPPRPGCAVRHLRCSDVDPVLAAWRERDPQLRALHEEPAYRDVFGKTRVDELLDLAAFASDAPVLRSAGLVGPTQLSRTPVWRLLALGLPLPRARWLRDLATTCHELASASPGGTEEARTPAAWAATVTGLLAERGAAALPAELQARDGALTGLAKELRAFREAPDAAQVLAWWGTRPAPASADGRHVAATR